jgi:hypothetical protein
MTFHSGRPQGPDVPAAGTVEAISSGSGEVGPLSQGSGEAGLISLGPGEAEPDLRWLGEVARTLLLGLVLGRRCPSSRWAICGHVTALIRLSRILRES